MNRPHCSVYDQIGTVSIVKTVDEIEEGAGERNHEGLNLIPLKECRIFIPESSLFVCIHCATQKSSQ